MLNDSVFQENSRKLFLLPPLPDENDISSIYSWKFSLISRNRLLGFCRFCWHLTNVWPLWSYVLPLFVRSCCAWKLCPNWMFFFYWHSVKLSTGMPWGEYKYTDRLPVIWQVNILEYLSPVVHYCTQIIEVTKYPKGAGHLLCSHTRQTK